MFADERKTNLDNQEKNFKRTNKPKQFLSAK